MIRVSQIKIPIVEWDENNTELFKDKIRKKLKLSKKCDFSYRIHRRNIDAREKEMLYFVCSLDVKLAKEKEKEVLSKIKKDVMRTPRPYSYYLKRGDQFMKHRPIVVGFGPAGLFASFLLAKHGYCPLVLERGEDMDARSRSVDSFFQNGELNEESNIQFGEGGAGTFSDGKLTARSKDPRVQMIYDTLIHFGAPKEIAYDSLPHIGSDHLKGVIKAMRKAIIAYGGEVHFNEKVEELIIEDSVIRGVKTTKDTYPSEHVILALGNSARDSVRKFYEQGVAMEAKDIAIGVRIEHQQKFINEAMYHQFASHPSLSAASYFLSNQKGAYTFCMCPGGSVVAATSLKEHVVTNGMSNYARDEKNANSAILISIGKEEMGEGVFAGMDYVDELEKKAFVLGGSNYRAPAQLVGDYLKHQSSTKIGEVYPSYPCGVTLCDLHELLPPKIGTKLEEGLIDFGKKIHGFDAHDSILTAIETRSSAPVRILRDRDTMNSLSVKGLYPCGEGAGYSGGITSSAIDGVKVAEKIITSFIYMEE